jgi:hypothetical protein
MDKARQIAVGACPHWAEWPFSESGRAVWIDALADDIRAAIEDEIASLRSERDKLRELLRELIDKTEGSVEDSDGVCTLAVARAALGEP